MKTLVGIVTFGNLPFTRLTIESIQATTVSPVEFFVIVGKPGDAETEWWLGSEGIPRCVHRMNHGFPASINDIYDHAWRNGDFDNVIIAGNDIVPYPGAVDALIATAAATDWEWICGSQFDVKSLVTRYPETSRYFTGANYSFTDFSAKPWEAHEAARLAELEARAGDLIEPDAIKDVRNLTLFKRSVMEKIGYADVNFWPGGYFEDNDYCTRARRAGVRGCGLASAAYFHFWSRTIHQGGKGNEHHDQFRANERYYDAKWGGPFGRETWERPFNGKPFDLGARVILPGTLEISSRELEMEAVRYWAGGGDLRPKS